MRTPLFALPLLAACSYSFGGGDDGSGGAPIEGTTVTGLTSAVASASGNTTTTQAATVSAAGPASSVVTTDAIASSTAETSGMNPVSLEPCSPTDDFEDEQAAEARWLELTPERWWESGHMRAQIQPGNNRTYFYLRTSETSQGNCFMSIQPSGYTYAAPRAVFARGANIAEFVNAVYYPYSDEFSAGYGGELRVLKQIPEPVALGLARYEGQIYAGFKTSTWTLVHLPALPSWATPGPDHDMGQIVGIGGDSYRAANFDDYGMDPITTQDLAGAIEWTDIPLPQ